MSFSNSPANDTIDFLFGVRWYDDWYGNYDEKKYKSYLTFAGLPFFGDEISKSIADGKTRAYLKRYNLDYSDIVDPSSLYNSANSSRTYNQLNWVSNNLHRLYR